MKKTTQKFSAVFVALFALVISVNAQNTTPQLTKISDVNNQPIFQLKLNNNQKDSYNLVVKDFLNIREGNGGVFQGNIYMPTTYKPESRVVLLNISYRFGNQKIQESRRRSTGSEDLQKRAND